MDGMDLGGAYGAGGAGDALQKILAQRMAAKQFAELQRQALAKESLGRDTLAEQSKYRLAQQDATAAQREFANQQKLEGNRLREENNFRQNAPPPGTEIPYDQQASYRHFGMGNLLNTQQQPTPDTTGQDFSGPLNQHTTLMPTAKQAAESEKQQGAGELKMDAKGNWTRIGKDNQVTPITVPGTLNTGQQPFKGYQPPPAFVQVLTDKGPAFADPHKPDAPVHPMKGEGGTQVNPPEPANMRTRRITAQQLQPSINYVEDLAKQLSDRGLFGPVMSRVRQHLAQAGTVDEFTHLFSSDPVAASDPLIGEFASALPLLASGAAIVHYQGRAGSSQATIQAFREMLSDAGTLDLFQGRLKGLDHFMGIYGSPAGSTVPPPPTGSAGSFRIINVEPAKK